MESTKSATKAIIFEHKQGKPYKGIMVDSYLPLKEKFREVMQAYNQIVEDMLENKDMQNSFSLYCTRLEDYTRTLEEMVSQEQEQLERSGDHPDYSRNLSHIRGYLGVLSKDLGRTIEPRQRTAGFFQNIGKSLKGAIDCTCICRDSKLKTSTMDIPEPASGAKAIMIYNGIEALVECKEKKKARQMSTAVKLFEKDIDDELRQIYKEQKEIDKKCYRNFIA
jgi:hypothetical protein